MVDRWDEDFSSSTPILLPHPDRQDIAMSFVHKTIVLTAIIAAIIALWAVTSQPGASGATGNRDATLGPPIAPLTQTSGGSTGK